jgi:hypothetical protein
LAKLLAPAEDKYPPLRRCWKDLEKLFMRDPAFGDGVFVQSWILMDFPFGSKGETALDYFEEFLRGIDGAEKVQPFIDAARSSRLVLHQDVMRTIRSRDGTSVARPMILDWQRRWLLVRNR